LVTDVGRLGAAHRDADGLVGVRTDLELLRDEATIQQLLAVELGLVRDPVQFLLHLLHFLLKRSAVRAAVRIVRRLDGEVTDTRQDVARLAERAFSRLRQ